MKSTRFWIITIAAIFTVSLVTATFQYTRVNNGKYAEIIQNGVLIRTVDLRMNQEFTVKAGNGGYNKIRVNDGKIAVIEASCPDKICVHQGAIANSSKTIVCLPNKLVIKIVSSKPDSVDGIAG